MALTFRQNSWHYKVVEFFSPGVPKSLCPYVRWLAVGVVLIAVIGSLVTFAAAGVVLNVLYLTDTLLGLYPSSLYEPKGWLEVATVIGGAINTIVAALTLYAGYNITRYKLKERKRERANAAWLAGGGAQALPEPEPSLLVEWFKSVHDKFCPNIAFE